MPQRRLPRIQQFQIHKDERGQIAFGMVIAFLFVFMIAGLALDGGFWYFDHRTAQNQAEAAAQAAALELPTSDTSAACTAARDALADNRSAGAGSADCGAGSCIGITAGQTRIVFSDANGDGSEDTVRVCIRRESLLLLSKMSGVVGARVSAAAAALAGPAGGSSVMPWALTPPDQDCEWLEDCDVPDGTGGTFSCDFVDCPFGLNPNRLMTFRLACNGNDDDAACDSGITAGGNFGAIAACGNGTDNYRDCIEGVATSSGFEVGSTVTVDAQNGIQGNNTRTSLRDYVVANGETCSQGSGQCQNGTFTCDSPATPAGITGLDPDGATAADTLASSGPCSHRKVVVPLLSSLVDGQTSTVLGLAVFYIAGWDRQGNASDTEGTSTIACGQNIPGSVPAALKYNCGAVWGYLLFGQNPAARFFLDRIDPNSNNPLAPILIALVE